MQRIKAICFLLSIAAVVFALLVSLTGSYLLSIAALVVSMIILRVEL